MWSLEFTSEECDALDSLLSSVEGQLEDATGQSHGWSFQTDAVKAGPPAVPLTSTSPHHLPTLHPGVHTAPPGPAATPCVPHPPTPPATHPAVGPAPPLPHPSCTEPTGAHQTHTSPDSHGTSVSSPPTPCPSHPGSPSNSHPPQLAASSPRCLLPNPAPIPRLCASTQPLHLHHHHHHPHAPVPHHADQPPKRPRTATMPATQTESSWKSTLTGGTTDTGSPPALRHISSGRSTASSGGPPGFPPRLGPGPSQAAHLSSQHPDPSTSPPSNCAPHAPFPPANLWPPALGQPPPAALTLSATSRSLATSRPLSWDQDQDQDLESLLPFLDALEAPLTRPLSVSPCEAALDAALESLERSMPPNRTPTPLLPPQGSTAPHHHHPHRHTPLSADTVHSEHTMHGPHAPPPQHPTQASSTAMLLHCRAAEGYPQPEHALPLRGRHPHYSPRPHDLPSDFHHASSASGHPQQPAHHPQQPSHHPHQPSHHPHQPAHHQHDSRRPSGSAQPPGGLSSAWPSHWPAPAALTHTHAALRSPPPLAAQDPTPGPLPPHHAPSHAASHGAPHQPHDHATCARPHPPPFLDPPGRTPHNEPGPRGQCHQPLPLPNAYPPCSTHADSAHSAQDTPVPAAVCHRPHSLPESHHQQLPPQHWPAHTPHKLHSGACRTQPPHHPHHQQVAQLRLRPPLSSTTNHPHPHHLRPANHHPPPERPPLPEPPAKRPALLASKSCPRLRSPEPPLSHLDQQAAAPSPWTPAAPPTSTYYPHPTPPHHPSRPHGSSTLHRHHSMPPPTHPQPAPNPTPALRQHSAPLPAISTAPSPQPPARAASSGDLTATAPPTAPPVLHLPKVRARNLPRSMLAAPPPGASRCPSVAESALCGASPAAARAAGAAAPLCTEPWGTAAPLSPPPPPPPPPAAAAVGREAGQAGGVGCGTTCGASEQGGLPSAQELMAQRREQQARSAGSLLDFKGTVRYVLTSVEVEWLCAELLYSLSGPPGVVGLDIEWRPQFKAGQAQRRTALVQLCYRKRTAAVSPVAAGTPADPDGRDCCCLLLHVAHSGITPALRAILEAPNVLKAGVNITGDAHKLRADFGVEVQGAVELGDLAEGRVLHDVPLVTRSLHYGVRWSLCGLTRELLGRQLAKPNHIRCGNWEQRPLAPPQIAYAATDAFASLAVYTALCLLPRHHVAPPPPLLAPPPAVRPLPDRWPAAGLPAPSASTPSAAPTPAAGGTDPGGHFPPPAQPAPLPATTALPHHRPASGSSLRMPPAGSVAPEATVAATIFQAGYLPTSSGVPAGPGAAAGGGLPPPLLAAHTGCVGGQHSIGGGAAQPPAASGSSTIFQAS